MKSPCRFATLLLASLMLAACGKEPEDTEALAPIATPSPAGKAAAVAETDSAPGAKSGADAVAAGTPSATPPGASGKAGASDKTAGKAPDATPGKAERGGKTAARKPEASPSVAPAGSARRSGGSRASSGARKASSGASGASSFLQAANRDFGVTLPTAAGLGTQEIPAGKYTVRIESAGQGTELALYSGEERVARELALRPARPPAVSQEGAWLVQDKRQEAGYRIFAQRGRELFFIVLRAQP